MIYWLFRGATSLLVLSTLVVWHVTVASSAAQCPDRCGEAKPAPKPGANVMQAPKLTLANGQSGSLEILDYQWFVTDVQAVKNGGQVVFVPKNERVPLGMQATMQPVISGDQKSVQVKLNLTQTSLASATVPS